jgi:hypothetical protein
MLHPTGCPVTAAISDADRSEAVEPTVASKMIGRPISPAIRMAVRNWSSLSLWEDRMYFQTARVELPLVSESHPPDPRANWKAPPLTTIFGFVGYSLVNSGDIGPYIAAASHLVFFMCACVILIRNLPILAIIGIACAIGSILALRNFATEFRPEPAWAPLTAVSVIALFALNLFSGSWLKSIALGLSS